ncbi:MAG: aminoacyl-tRNA hydrolase [bacterium]|nr:aminoacyl-tRNA hydrolase [bacterium]
MSYIIFGLGNPGVEYEKTRHNAGFLAVDAFAKKFGADEWKQDKKKKAEIALGAVGKKKLALVKPQTFMNRSGSSVSAFVKDKKAAEKIVVVHDDLDIPLGKFKISFGKSSGGHRGVESVIKALKTKDFVRVRIGISPVTASGKIKKPSSEKVVDEFIVKDFKPSEADTIKKTIKKVVDAIEVVIAEGREKAMGEFN